MAQEEPLMNRLLKMVEVAQILDVSEDRAYDLARRGLLPIVRLGRQVRVDEAKLTSWINAGGAGLPGE